MMRIGLYRNTQPAALQLSGWKSVSFVRHHDRGKWLGIFPSPKAHIGGGRTSTTISLRVVCSRLVFREVTSPNTRTSNAHCCMLTGRVQSLYGGDKRVKPRQQAVIEGRESSTFFQILELVQRQSSEFFQVLQPIFKYVDVGMKIEIFPSPRAQEEARA